MERVTLEIPDELAKELHIDQTRVKELVLLGFSQLKIQEALSLYQRGIVTFGRAAEIASLTERELVRFARAYSIRPRWDETMLREELNG